ncbi:CAP domain-containing protein [Oricola cellulosilytica]|uniref:CAP domain-containing protein n=1 Tax=Oricola cellulosilytica TaxID=1429082 RepID=A0A4R0PFD5_9HYPH|nr:CAP domain-containing protein [Oricola cellulosilytica]TCD16547.1 CAP domain-containing protein [Oricola cellulosilytica]
MIGRRALLTGAGVLLVAPVIAGCTTRSATVDGPIESGIVTGEALAPVNTLRVNNGLQPLLADDVLSRAALDHAEAMAVQGRVTHAGFRGRMRAAGVNFPAAENLAFGQPDTESAVYGWSQSAGHRRNLLDDEFGRVGVAYASAAGGRRYWAMVLSP